MTTKHIDVVMPGTVVEYHGSLVSYHGLMTVEGIHYPYEILGKDDIIRYILRYGPGNMDYLRNVRPVSFTEVVDTEITSS